MIAFNERPGSILDVNDLLNLKRLAAASDKRSAGLEDKFATAAGGNGTLLNMR